MRKLLCVLVLGVIPPCVLAQDWTPEQLAVIEDLESCWDAWDAARESQDYSLWSEPCLASEHAVSYWAAPDGGLWTDRDWKRGLSNKWFDPETKYQWVSLRPLRIYIIMDGVLALVYYNPYGVQEAKDGKLSYPASWSFEVLRKEDGRWKFVASMATPAGGE